MNKTWRIIIKHAAALAAIALLYILFPSCPVKTVTGVACPTCGMSRALLALLHLDFKVSFEYHPLALPIVFFILFVFHKDLFGLRKRTINIILLSGALIIFTVYLIRLSLGFLP